jgi:hypothetical protein
MEVISLLITSRHHSSSIDLTKTYRIRYNDQREKRTKEGKNGTQKSRKSHEKIEIFSLREMIRIKRKALKHIFLSSICTYFLET